MGKFSITTAIAYTNAPPHVGFALELTQADVLARWHRLRGEKCFFLTVTDEHGRKVMKAAADAGEDLQTFVDRLADRFKELASALRISNDDFIRTSDRNRHWPGVRKLWKRLEEAGDLSRGTYRGLYCEGCEAFKKPSDLRDGRCPDHQTVPEVIEEENWFFRLSRYRDELRRIIESDEIRIVPEERKHEVLAFLAQGLEDVSFSRPRKDLPWGMGRCVSKLPHWPWFWPRRRGRASIAFPRILAGRRARHRKRHPSFPCDHLACDAPFGEASFAENDSRPWAYPLQGDEDGKEPRERH